MAMIGWLRQRLQQTMPPPQQEEVPPPKKPQRGKPKKTANKPAVAVAVAEV
jgi:hypothetical protein